MVGSKRSPHNSPLNHVPGNVSLFLPAERDVDAKEPRSAVQGQKESHVMLLHAAVCQQTMNLCLDGNPQSFKHTLH